ncbi:hypothetical protein AAFF_G00273830 [Aldrovandia affinis]|uniref:Zona pellucida sperm-binding protein 3 n=1 Tax=Aldrovandia affinis TaxID=143900 RepID=A0AAD7STI8_9TELE|nr:hypothetical protein AAFF_G00273830 [Aldrovandia affinis]
MTGGMVSVGVVMFGLFSCLCDAQWGPLPSKANTQAPTTTRRTYKRPTLPGPFVSAHQTFKRPTLPKLPATTRPTFQTPKPTTAPPKTVVDYPPLVKPDTVRAQCEESSVQVEVDLDLLGIGQLIEPSDITLGGCAPVGQDNSAQALLFESELQGCGSTLTPKALGSTPIIRTNGAVVGIKCRYMRLNNVSSNALKPTWIPYRSTLSGEELLVFSLRLMTDDLMQKRSSDMFFLGDLMYIEASVSQANHVPLRVFVDTCVATLDPDMDSVPRYAFIENQGCFMDSKLTSSRSRFLPRVQDDKLSFQLDAFRFAQESRSSVAANGMVSQSQSALLMAEDHNAGVSPEAVVMAGVVAAVGLVCVVVLATVLRWRRRKPTL